MSVMNAAHGGLPGPTDEFLIEMKEVRELHENLQSAIPHMLRNVGMMTRHEILEYHHMAETVRSRVSTLREQLERIESTAFFGLKQRVQELEYAARQLCEWYWNQAIFYEAWVDKFRNQMFQQASLVKSLLDDPIFDTTMTPLHGIYRNDPDISAASLASFQQFVGQGPLFSDSVALRQASAPSTFPSTDFSSLDRHSMITHYPQSTRAIWGYYPISNVEALRADDASTANPQYRASMNNGPRS
ncbi:uncharacterized protein N7482_006601 [Penicillium canariense]|uniref:Uncharacterized protein n=1 Tax=Penicillium canariense TaxID=189055 RepID=A0A9W9HY35_9EURO|nr:uncharacterized protein N7482_006601 [Penicillium canariense]KAJ5159597.1 hypothetical protein N7482_006601 [Penicillium canariense]